MATTSSKGMSGWNRLLFYITILSLGSACVRGLSSDVNLDIPLAVEENGLETIERIEREVINFGEEISLAAEAPTLSRAKRSASVSSVVSNDYTFLLEPQDAFSSSSDFHIGSVIPYKLTVTTTSSNSAAFNLKIQAQLDSTGEKSYFSITDVRFGTTGSNLDGMDFSNIEIRYGAPHQNSKWDSATIHMGEVVNSGSDTSNAAANKFEVLFDAQALVHDGLTDGTQYSISVGAEFADVDVISLVQDHLTFREYSTSVTKVDPTAIISGPSSLKQGNTGVFILSTSIHDIYNDLTLDVLLPPDLPDAFVVDRITVGSYGIHYENSLAPGDVGNSSYSNDTDYGSVSRLHIGTVINSGYNVNNPNDDISSNTIDIEVAVTLKEEHTINNALDYDIGFALTSISPYADMMWAGYHTLLPEVKAPVDPGTTPQFTAVPSADEVTSGGYFGALLNMTLVRGSFTSYQLEVTVPEDNNGNPLLNIHYVRISKIGFNMPHFDNETNVPLSFTNITTGSDYVKFVTWNLGYIANVAQRNLPDDDIIQFEVALEVLPSASSHFVSGDNVSVTFAMKYHDGSLYWMGDAITQYTTALTYEDNQVTRYVLVNAMGDNAVVYPDTAVVVDLEMVIPPRTDYENFHVEFRCPNFTNSMTALRFIEMFHVYSGKSIMLIDRDTVSVLSDPTEHAADNTTVHESVNITYNHVASMRDISYDVYEYEESTVILRVIAIARSEEDAGLVDGGLYHVDVTINMGSAFVGAATIGIVYRSALENMYAGSDWQPSYTMSLSDWLPNNSVSIGSMLTYEVTVGLPYRTHASLLVQAGNFSDPLMVCAVELITHNTALVDFFPPTYVGTDTVNSPETHKNTYSEVNWSAVTSFKQGYWIDNTTDSEAMFRIYVHLGDSAVNETFYNFGLSTTIGLLPTYVEVPEIHASSEPLTMVDDRQPTLNITHFIGTNKLNQGGSEWIVIDFYVTPNTSYKYELTVDVAYETAHYGSNRMVEGHVIYMGENLACSHPLRYENATLQWSPDNPTDIANIAYFDFGTVPNIAPNYVEQVNDTNRITVMVYFSLNSVTSTYNTGDDFKIAVDLSVNNREAHKVYFFDLEVIDKDDEANKNYDEGQPVLEILSVNRDTNFYVGEILEYTATLTLPVGGAYTELEVMFESPALNNEVFLNIYDLEITGHGPNVIESSHEFQHVSERNQYLQMYSQNVYFGFLRNHNSTGINLHVEPNNETDNLISFSFKIRLLDNLLLVDGHMFEIISCVLYGSPAQNEIRVPAIGDTNITVNATEHDEAKFIWDVSIVNMPSPVVQSSVITFSLVVGIDPTSTRFPEQVKVIYRVPPYSRFENYYNYTGLNDEFIPPTAVENDGLKFIWEKIRYDYHPSLLFEITVDPDAYLEHGLLTRYITVPVNIYFEEEDKDDNHVHVHYTDMKVLQFELEVPENVDPLGVASSATIKDCQITASSDDGTHFARLARLNSASGWATLSRGPPFYQKEYIQVDMGSEFKFTGLTIQPFDDAEVSRILSLNIQHSIEGIRWEYMTDSNQSYTTKVFNIEWGDSPTAADTRFLVFEADYFINRFIRIIPLNSSRADYAMKLRFELHGYPWPYKATPPTYNCPPTPTGTSRFSYHERQYIVAPNSTQVFVCMIKDVSDKPHCSGSHDFGMSWFTVDYWVLNVIGYESTNHTYIAISRDQQTYLKSSDSGSSWQLIEDSYYTFITNHTASYFHAKEVPFPLGGSSDQEWYDNYGYPANSSHTWHVRPEGLYACDISGSDISSKDWSNIEPVAYWGRDDWSGP